MSLYTCDCLLLCFNFLSMKVNDLCLSTANLFMPQSPALTFSNAGLFFIPSFTLFLLYPQVL